MVTIADMHTTSWAHTTATTGLITIKAGIAAEKTRAPENPGLGDEEMAWEEL